MEQLKPNQRLDTWVEGKLSLGKYSFSLAELRIAFPSLTAIAIKFALKRLTDKGKVVSIYKGFYQIIPPQYAGRGILPPSLFLDSLMQYLQRPYYLAILNAASYHGASHQQPQEFFVVTNFPVLRATFKKGMRISYMSKKEIPKSLLEQKKTEAGYITISNPALTATDLIQYENRIGGVNRAASVINELAEFIKPEGFSQELIAHSKISSMQRLGYILEFVCYQKLLADRLFLALQDKEIKLFRTPLRTMQDTKGFPATNRWKIIVNTEVDIDE